MSAVWVELFYQKYEILINLHSYILNFISLFLSLYAEAGRRVSSISDTKGRNSAADERLHILWCLDI